MEKVYTFFLKIKYLKELRFIDQFYEIYQEFWGTDLSEEKRIIIENEILPKELSTKQRAIDESILSNPIIVANWHKVQKEELGEKKSNWFYKINSKDQARLIEYIDCAGKIEEIKWMLSKDYDWYELPQIFFDMTKEQREYEILIRTNEMSFLV